jgi:hypothetical protein
MPYCPDCFAEFQPGIAQCSDCGTPLVEGSPVFCPRCNDPVVPEDAFCSSCGILLVYGDDDALPECAAHPEVLAIGSCVVCGKPVCEECAREVDGRFFCDDDSHYDVHQGYVVAYTTATDYEAAMIKANLEGAGIGALIFNQHDHVYFTNMGSLAVVNVMVPKYQIEKANEIIALLSEESGEEDEAAAPGEDIP